MKKLSIEQQKSVIGGDASIPTGPCGFYSSCSNYAPGGAIYEGICNVKACPMASYMIFICDDGEHYCSTGFMPE